ncbi:MAG: AbrB/MazE/SpoVT family DNA-binding domain-containing protein [Candidatus Methylomirabilis sp.]|nr:AbrB/MazE/SpoVT family DNA-binding domain-containing protein [Deltaproteobacteria bacterium]
MAKAKVGANRKVALPTKVVRSLHLVEGDELEVHVREGGVLLVPKKALAKGQEWYWSEEHQAKEREADADLRAGRVGGPLKTKADLRAFFAEIEAEVRAQRRKKKRTPRA